MPVLVMHRSRVVSQTLHGPGQLVVGSQSTAQAPLRQRPVRRSLVVQVPCQPALQSELDMTLHVGWCWGVGVARFNARECVVLQWLQRTHNSCRAPRRQACEQTTLAVPCGSPKSHLLISWSQH